MNRAEAEDRLMELVDGYDHRSDTSDVTFALARPSTGWTWGYGEGRRAVLHRVDPKLYTRG